MLNGWMCVHACIGLVEMEWERAAEKLMLERVNVRGVEENEGIPDSPCQTLTISSRRVVLGGDRDLTLRIR